MPFLCAHMHWTRPGDSSATTNGGSTQFRSRCVLEFERLGTGHPEDTAAAHRIACIALAIARQHRSLLLSVVEVIVKQLISVDRCLITPNQWAVNVLHFPPIRI